MAARARAAFVGRESELDELERALEAAGAGSGSTVLVAGEAGIGKSRLAAEAAQRARDDGFEVLIGRSIDLVGTELPYQPFVEALQPVGKLRRGQSQLRVFEETLALIGDRAAEAPVLLVLEDVHWADTSTLDLIVFLAHNLADRRVLLLATHRADEPSSAERTRRLANGVRRSGSGLELELAPLERDELTTLLAEHAGAPLPAAVTDAIAARSEGNPFFAEELLAAGPDPSGDLPHGLRDLLLQRVNELDPATQGLLRLAAAAGRDVGYPLLSAAAALPEPEVRESLRRAVEARVLVSEPTTSSFRFRHALLAEAIYSTILPGEREELHARLAEELARSEASSAAELAPHWAAAGRSAEALAASVLAAGQAEAVFGLAEAYAQLERALALWPSVPDAAELAGIGLADLCAWTAELADEVGDDRRAVELARRAIELAGGDDPHRAALLHVRLGEYLYGTGSNEAALAAIRRAVELVPTDPPSTEGAYCLATLAGALMVAWAHAESLPIAEQALALARRIGAGTAEVRALTAQGADLAYLGRAEKGLACLRRALQLAEEIDDRIGLDRAYVNSTDILTMLGRPRESARLAELGLEATHGYGSTVLVANLIEALIAVGEWDRAETESAAAIRRFTASFPYVLLMLRAELEIGRGDFDDARAHLEDAGATLREDRGLGLFDACVADLAFWERRWTDSDAAVREGLMHAQHPEAGQIRVLVCARGLRAHAELAALARARRDRRAADGWLDRAGDLLDIARAAAAEAQAITPNAAGWLALAEAEHVRARGDASPDAWLEAAAAWERLERPPLAAYCRWRHAEALVAAGASRTEASVPARDANAVATRIGARPLLRELELLGQRARLDLVPPEDAVCKGRDGMEEILGLTPREAEVLALIARGYTNREIADALVISTKTASAHVSHILRKLGASNRLEAATIAHRLAPAAAPTSKLGA
jgi:DNA-binding CsgD family transcriptional regulator/tetratricopeptide (TPR) repeat protein